MRNGTVPAPRVQAALDVLRARGERVTRVRQAVIEVLDSTAEHLDADEIVGPVSYTHLTLPTTPYV